MKIYNYILLLTGCSIMLFQGCSELEENTAINPDIRIHKTGILNPTSDDFHGKIIVDNNWDMSSCWDCHSRNYSGGIVDASCLSCHDNDGGPEACNTCHGSFADPNFIAPPRDTQGNSNVSDRGVGFHTSHLYENVMGNSASCGDCHLVPDQVYVQGHVDTQLPAEVNLKGTAVLFGADNAAYSDGTCSDTYCHGNFEFYRDSTVAENRFAYTADKMTGFNITVTWNDNSREQAECGSCHGLPPTGHITAPLTVCFNCHGDVIDSQGNIIDKSKHINGVIDAR